MTQITINAGVATKALQEFVETLGGEKLAAINAVAGRSTVLAAQEYHRQFDSSGGWKGDSQLGSSGSNFGSAITSGWFFKASDPDSATIANGAPLYAQKVYGGTIVPKRAKALTIPLITEAKGRRAADYEIFFGRKLFTIPGRNVLFEQGPQASESVLNRTYGRRKGGQKVQISARGRLRAVFALVSSVDQKPWPGALPPDDALAEAFADAWTGELEKRVLEL